MPNIPDDLAKAILALDAESVGDFIYHIRDRELLGWDGPRVTAWSDACATIYKYAKEIKANA